MPLLSKIKNVFCCTSNNALLDDDDDDVASIFEYTPVSRPNNDRQEVSEKPLLSDYDNNTDSTTTRPFYQANQVIVKSVLRKNRHPSISSTQNHTPHTPRRRYNVLLFGESLTAGWIKGPDGYGTYHPYGLRIQKRFEEKGLDVEVTVSGVPGECVVQSMEERLKRELEQPGKWYDWVVILGGTNDVINGYSAWDIFDGLKKLYTLCSKHGARILGVTIPEFDWDLVNHLDYQRRIVNEHLNVYNNSTTRNAYTLFLLDKFFPMHSLTTEQRKIFWDQDGVHPTEDGYNLMGELHDANILSCIITYS
ncbi:8650_t:CDS:2 [Funneliformis caledonium]|uniref:8650_t:CDS:1 n=1 Tax=Funneliformis caledonium TaxID=1117310 RepID=A0A9N9BJR8_9GLOM|nr:8650_t:CDS:2 [Funneliformis caledonium]